MKDVFRYNFNALIRTYTLGQQLVQEKSIAQTKLKDECLLRYAVFKRTPQEFKLFLGSFSVGIVSITLFCSKKRNHL